MAWNDSLTALSVGLKWLGMLVREQDEALKAVEDADKDIIARNEMMSFVTYSLENEVKTLGY